VAYTKSSEQRRRNGEVGVATTVGTYPVCGRSNASAFALDTVSTAVVAPAYPKCSRAGRDRGTRRGRGKKRKWIVSIIVRMRNQ